MDPDLFLRIATAFAGFVSKTMLAFGVCLILSWLADSPARRFTVWLGFLYGATAYWLSVASSFLHTVPAAAVASGSIPVAPSTSGAMQVPMSWALPMGVVFLVLGLIYMLGLGSILFSHWKKQRQLKWVLRFTTQPPDKTATVFQSLAKNLGVGRTRLLILSGAASPATFGWIRPVILLPDVCLRQDQSELEDILRHELHHVRRWDFAWNRFAVLCLALLFFHPAVWYALRKMQFDRELACDLAVVSDTPRRRAEYAECLLHFARLNAAQDPQAWGIDFAASPNHLKARVHSILTETKGSSGWLLGLRIACGLVLLAGFLRVAPSLAVLLAYAHQQSPRPLASVVSIQPEGQPARRARRRPQWPTRVGRMAPDPDVARATESKTTGPVLNESDDSRRVEQSNVGPQLLHRPAAGSKDASAGKQQTITLVDNDNSASGNKDEAHNKTQVVQQTVTAAAGIYKRIGSVERH
jgi:beta-lactamase regulating signal transducer with metallopeptidase domain